jgi:hypothetical protein
MIEVDQYDRHGQIDAGNRAEYDALHRREKMGKHGDGHALRDDGHDAQGYLS